MTQNCRLLYLPAAATRRLIETQPSFALCLIEGLVAKGKCYSALAQMLGTRSITERPFTPSGNLTLVRGWRSPHGGVTGA